jgi:two-component sensor histidine kinase
MIISRIESSQDSDANHRMSNNLAMISAIIRRKARRLQEVGGEEARGILEDAAFQIEVVANLHKLLSNREKGARVDLDQYLGSVCNAVVPSISGRIKPKYKLSCGYSAAPEFAVSIGLAVAELLTNAVRHAHPSADDGSIAVAAMRRGNVLVIEVCDNGVGLPEGYDAAAGEDLGLRLVRQTAARWGGTAEFDDSLPGLCVRLVLPLEPPHTDT